MFIKKNRAKEWLICESDIIIMHIIMLFMEKVLICLFFNEM